MIHLHVLLVDGDAEERQIIEAALAGDSFFTLRACVSGAKAHNAAVSWRPDIVLADSVLPDMDAAALLRRLRVDRRTAAIPVVLLSAPCASPDVEWCRAIGAVGGIAKPIDPTQLAAELRRFVAVEGVLSAAREGFLQRLEADATSLSAWRTRLIRKSPDTALIRINAIAHSLAGAGGIYGFAGISCASAALCTAAENSLAGRAKPIEVERALNRLLERISP